MGFIDDIKARAKTSKKTIVLPETEDIRTYEAAEAVLKEGTATRSLSAAKKRLQRTKVLSDIAEQQSQILKSEKTDAHIRKTGRITSEKGNDRGKSKRTSSD